MAELWEKSATVDPEVRAYIYSLVNAVGGSSTYDDSYAVGDDALAALHDIVRWLKLYDEKLRRWDVKRCLAEANLLKGDLLEILALWPEDQLQNKSKSKLALACLQLMVPLTWPFELDDEKFTVNNARHLPYLQLAQVGYKRAILAYEHTKILRSAVRVSLSALAQPRRDRSRRDEGIIKLMLYLFRNIAYITQPPQLPSQGDEGDISRSSTIQAFQEQDIFHVLLTIGSGANDEFQEQDVILLEILFHLLKGVDARKIFMDKEQVTQEETSELQMLMQKEKAMLNGYKKHAPSRHNRFGTMVWVKRDDHKMSTVAGQATITDQSTTLRHMDQSKKWNKPKHRGKLAKEFNEESDFGMLVELTDNARKQLRGFVEDFLDSAFNPLFASLRKAIERETDRVQPSLHHRQFFYVVNWFLGAESARRESANAKAAENANGPGQMLQDNNFAYIAAVLDQETFVLLNRHMQRSFDEKNWQELQSTLLCFTRILITVQAMAESKDEEDQEIAENIQSRIFYEETTHDRLVQILRGYTHQGFAYLDNITECVHVFVRMLEKYSKQNVDLMIRSKRRARKKKNSQPTTDAAGAAADADEEAEDAREAHLAVSERKFDSARFSAKFLSQGCVDTFITFMTFHSDLTPAQLKRCHRYLYRLAFKHELSVFLFRVDILQLLHRMIKGPEGLDPKMEGFLEWQTLVQQVFRKCIKWVERSTEGDGWREMTVVEMLFSKIPNTLFYLQNGFERVAEKRPPRPPAELQVKASIDTERRVGVAVSLMIDQSKTDAINWIKTEIQRAVAEREAWEQEAAARSSVNEQAEGDVEESSPPSFFLGPDSDERRSQLFKDKHLRLLLSTLGFQRLGLAEDIDASWIIPHELTLTQLQTALEQITRAEFDPPTFEDGKSAADMIRVKAFSRQGANTYSDSDSGNEDEGGEIDEALFPPNLREQRKEGTVKTKRHRLSKRNRKELTEEEIKAKAKERKRKEKEKNSKIKSALYVTANDDLSDEEADAEFFRLEEERRINMEGIIRGQLLKEAQDGEKEKKRRKRKAGAVEKNDGRAKKRRTSSDEDDHDSINAQEMDTELDLPATLHIATTSSDSDVSSDSHSLNSDTESEQEEEAKETPSTSPHMLDERALTEVSSNVGVPGIRRTKAIASDDDDDDDDDDEGASNSDSHDRAPVSKRSLVRRNIRAGFIIDDSDDDDDGEA